MFKKLKPSHWSNDNKLPQGGKGHPFWAVRAWWREDNARYRLRWAVEWYAVKRARHCDIQYSRDYAENEHTICFGIPRLFALYLTRHLEHSADIHDSHCWGISFHDWSIWFQWKNGMDWSNRQPWYQSFNFNFPNFFLGQMDRTSKELSVTNTFLNLPEGRHPVKVTLSYDVWTRPRWPWPVYKKFAGDVESLDPNGIPAPGKGENSWDCGDNNFISLGCTAKTVEEAIGEATKSVLYTRKRHGGSHEYESVEKES